MAIVNYPNVQAQLFKSGESLKKQIEETKVNIFDAKKSARDAKEYVEYLRKEERVLNGVGVNIQDIDWFKQVVPSST